MVTLAILLNSKEYSVLKDRLHAYQKKKLIKLAS